MYNYPSIYISHHPSEAEKAKGLANALLQIQSIDKENIAYLETILPGKDVKHEVFDQIEKANFIIVLPSTKYLGFCREEISWIKNSNCYKNRKVIPVPTEPCLWRDVFPDIMPLPKEAWFQDIPFDDNGLYKIVLGIKDTLDNTKFLINRYVPIILARADSTSNEHTQEFLSEYQGIALKHDEILAPIQGDSMSPLYEEGDFAICKPIDIEDITPDKIERRKTFVIRTKTQGTLLKYIGSISPTRITLVSENSAHSDIELDGDEIDRIFQVVRSVKIRSEL